MQGSRHSDNHRYTEDLAQLAAAQYRLADQYCDICRNYHAVYPYLRLARTIDRSEPPAAGPEFAALTELFGAGWRRVLIAGAADTGLLALTARAAAESNLDVFVLDRCRTPLELCRQFAQRWSLTATILHQDLTTLDIAAGFDVVFASVVLRFIAAERHADVLARLCRALRPHGRLVHVVHVSPSITGEAAGEDRDGYSKRTVAELMRGNIPLPDSSEHFVRRLNEYVREFESREGALGSVEQILALHCQAGFEVASCTSLDTGITLPRRGFLAKLAKRRCVIIAKPTATGGSIE
jgi:SAM-dependent methyltransferase